MYPTWLAPEIGFTSQSTQEILSEAKNTEINLVSSYPFDLIDA